MEPDLNILRTKSQLDIKAHLGELKISVITIVIGLRLVLN